MPDHRIGSALHGVTVLVVVAVHLVHGVNGDHRGTRSGAENEDLSAASLLS